jgi:hypothetical protein
VSLLNSLDDRRRVSSDLESQLPERVRAGEALLTKGGGSSRGDGGRSERRGARGAVRGVRSGVGEGKGDGGGSAFVVGVGVVEDGSLELDKKRDRGEGGKIEYTFQREPKYDGRTDGLNLSVHVLLRKPRLVCGKVIDGPLSVRSGLHQTIERSDFERLRSGLSREEKPIERTIISS